MWKTENTATAVNAKRGGGAKLRTGAAGWRVCDDELKPDVKTNESRERKEKTEVRHTRTSVLCWVEMKENLRLPRHRQGLGARGMTTHADPLVRHGGTFLSLHSAAPGVSGCRQHSGERAHFSRCLSRDRLFRGARNAASNAISLPATVAMALDQTRIVS